MNKRIGNIVYISVVADVLLALILFYLSVINNQILNKYYELDRKVESINEVLNRWELDQ